MMIIVDLTILSLFFLFTSFYISSPFHMSLNMILFSLLLFLNSIFLMNTMWFFITFSMMFISGMMVIILYFCSLSTFYEFSLNTKNFTLLFFMMLLFMLSQKSKIKFPINYNIKYLNSMYNYPNFYSYFFFSILMMISLFSMVKLLELWKGSLKMKF